MSDLNSGSWAGRIMSEPKTFSGEGGSIRVRFILACHRSVKDPANKNGWGEKTDRFPVVAWGNQAERLSKLNVGAYITLSGRLQSYEYDRKIEVEGGGATFTIPLTSYEIVLETFNQVIKGRGQDETTSESQPDPQQEQGQEQKEDLPF